MNIIYLKRTIIFQVGLMTIWGAVSVKSQVAAGGGYTLNRAVIASGGGTSSDTANNVYKVTGTIGEAIAGKTSTAALYSLKGGFFFASSPAVPTAAGVSVRGRVLTTTGRGIKNVPVTMTDAGGLSRTAISSTFGYFSFADVPSGETYIFTVRAKRFTFSQPAQVFSIVEDFDEIVFVGDPMWLDEYR